MAPAKETADPPNNFKELIIDNLTENTIKARNGALKSEWLIEKTADYVLDLKADSP